MADDQSDRLIETLSSCPRALQELSKALMPTLMKSLMTLTEETCAHEVATELNTSRNSVATDGSDEEDDSNHTQRDEPWVQSHEGNEAPIMVTAMKPVIIITMMITIMVTELVIMAAAMETNYTQPRILQLVATGCRRCLASLQVVCSTLGAGQALHRHFHHHQVG